MLAESILASSPQKLYSLIGSCLAIVLSRAAATTAARGICEIRAFGGRSASRQKFAAQRCRDGATIVACESNRAVAKLHLINAIHSMRSGMLLAEWRESEASVSVHWGILAPPLSGAVVFAIAGREESK